MERLFKEDDTRWTSRGALLADKASAVLKSFFSSNLDLSPREISYVLMHEVLTLEMDELIRRQTNVTV